MKKMKKLYEDDPRAENWDKHGRVYRPATEILGSSSMEDMIFLGSGKIYHEGYRRKCVRRNCRKSFVPKIHSQKYCHKDCRDLVRLEKAEKEYEQTL